MVPGSRAGQVARESHKSERLPFVEYRASHAHLFHSVTWKDIYVKNVPFPVRLFSESLSIRGLIVHYTTKIYVTQK